MEIRQTQVEQLKRSGFFFLGNPPGQDVTREGWSEQRRKLWVVVE